MKTFNVKLFIYLPLFLLLAVALLLFAVYRQAVKLEEGYFETVRSGLAARDFLMREPIREYIRRNEYEKLRAYCANAAKQMNIRVTVIDDTQNPDLAVDFADMTVERGSVVTLPAGTAQDNADPNVTVTVSVAFGTEQVEFSGNTFTAEKEGTYTITWTAQDSAGNTTTVTAYVTVQPAGGGSNVGLIIGIVAGVVVVAAAAVIVSVIVIRKKKVKAGASDATENDSDASENK